MFKSLEHHTPAANSYFMSYNLPTNDMFINFYMVTGGGDRMFLDENHFTHYGPIICQGEADELINRIEARHQSSGNSKEFREHYLKGTKPLTNNASNGR